MKTLDNFLYNWAVSTEAEKVAFIVGSFLFVAFVSFWGTVLYVAVHFIMKYW